MSNLKGKQQALDAGLGSDLQSERTKKETTDRQSRDLGEEQSLLDKKSES
jgi:hypothetical protein